jgi:hypothetical protein
MNLMTLIAGGVGLLLLSGIISFLPKWSRRKPIETWLIIETDSRQMTSFIGQTFHTSVNCLSDDHANDKYRPFAGNHIPGDFAQIR